jgi:segregation and condensation protein B
MSKRKKKDDAPSDLADDAEGVVEIVVDGDLTNPDIQARREGDTQVVQFPTNDEAWDGPTNAGTPDEIAELAAASVEATAEISLEGASEGAADVSDPSSDPAPAVAPGRLSSIIESLLFASDHPLGLTELKRLVGERDGAKITAAIEDLRALREDGGVQVIQVAGGWQLRTSPENVAWVARILSGKPPRLSRAMLETLAIVAYRQPITRPEIDEIRGVDCGPVLKTLLERGLARMIGKKEEVGRPILYGTTPEFLRTFSLRDLSELPTLREFHELGEAEMAKVDAAAPNLAPPAAEGPLRPPAPVISEPDPDEEDALLGELDRATEAATQATAPPPSATPPDGPAVADDTSAE